MKYAWPSSIANTREPRDEAKPLMQVTRGLGGVFAIGLFLVATKVHAEYRVFQLAVTDGKTGQSRVVVSTLDNYQYPQYHHLNSADTITIQASWMCWQRSDGFKAPCPNPRPQGPSAPGPTQPSAKSASAAR
jgi:hypothetical protein